MRLNWTNIFFSLMQWNEPNSFDREIPALHVNMLSSTNSSGQKQKLVELGWRAWEWGEQWLHRMLLLLSDPMECPSPQVSGFEPGGMCWRHNQIKAVTWVRVIAPTVLLYTWPFISPWFMKMLKSWLPSKTVFRSTSVNHTRLVPCMLHPKMDVM